MTLRYLYSSRDKEQDGTQFLQIGVTMAKLWPLLNYCELFMLYTEDFCMHYYARFSQIGSLLQDCKNRVNNLIMLN